MTVRDRREVEQLYTRARELQPAARAAFVQDVSHDNPDLRDEVLSLLERTEAAEGFFQKLSGTMPSLAVSTDLVSPGDDLQVGQEVGHYRILGRIGAGGMGTVYRARDTRLDREVALKFLPAHLTESHDAEERLLAEAKAAAALEHGNVCTVHEVGETADGRPFIAMALYEGETLKERLRRGPLPPEEAIEIAAQIARGLAAAHARGIVHRDVKPGNVLLTAGGTVKLLDFGLARLADATLTRPGATPGTVAYMSPEQTRGDALDPRTDLWSLGVVLYEMLAGMRPFRGGNDRTLIQAILHNEPELLRKHSSDVPESVQRIMDRLLGKKPETRYGSAGELLVDLEQGRSGSPARPVASRRRWIPRTTTRRLALGAAGVLLALALFLGIRTMGDADAFVPAADATGAVPAIAVLPFSVHGEGLGVWREGMVDLLSMGLNGAGGLRTIDNRTLLARWNEEVGDGGMADLPHALGVARRTQARYALVGSLVAAGPRLRLAADIYDLGSGRSLGQAHVEGLPDSVLTLVDRLGMQALRVILEKDPGDLPSIDLASVTTSSLLALKAYLNGEVRYRRSDFEGAIEEWERAVRADSLFALAYFSLAEAYGWDEGRDVERAQGMLDRAQGLANRLPQHEATILRAMWAIRHGMLDGIELVEESLRRNPDDAVAWYELGEAYYHLPGAMRGPDEAERAFQRAAELHPASAPYRAHLLDLAFEWRPDSARIAREIEALGRLAPGGVRTRASRIAFALPFGNPSAREQARAALDTLDLPSATQVYFFLRHPRFARERERVHSAIDVRLDDQARAYIGFVRFYDLSFRDGRIRRALSLLDDPRTPDQIRHCGPLSLSVRSLPVPEEILEGTLSVSRADSSLFDDPAWVTCAAVYAAKRGRWRQHAALLSHAEELAGRHLAAGDSASARDWDRFLREGRAHGLWQQGRKVEALHGFESLLSTHATASWVVWYVGQLSFELGRFDEAERAFRSVWKEPLAHLYLGRIYERMDRPAEALEAYELFATAWQNADPELQPLVEEARLAITRLSGAED